MYPRQIIAKIQSLRIFLKNTGEEKNINTLDACIAFVSSIDEIDRIIVGVDSLKHLEEIVQSYKLKQVTEFPDISSNDIDLINPSLWKKS